METHSQYSCLENPMDRGAWQVAVHRVTKSDLTEEIWHVWHYFKAGYGD